MQAYQRVVWAEGTFLGQQHFQLWDQFQERAQTLRAAASRAFPWGVVEMDIDPDTLAAGRFVLRRCIAIMADGRLIDYAAGRDGELSLDLAPVGATRQVDIDLAMPRNDGACGIAGYEDRGQLCAWRADYVEYADQHDPARTREVATARPNLALLRGDQPKDQFTTLTIVKLRRDGDGQWRLSPEHVPALCHIGASDVLIATLQRIQERLSARLCVLHERRQRLGAIADFGPSDLAEFLLLQQLAPAESALAHYLHVRRSHPEPVYFELLRLIAALATFHPEVEVQSSPPYDHDALGAGFAACERSLSSLLADVVPRRMSGLKLVRETDSLLVANGVDGSMLRRSAFYLAVRHEAQDPTWQSDFPRQVKVGAREDIELIIGSALIGVPVVHVQRPPNRLPVKSGYEYFRLESGGEFWERVVEHQSLAVFLPRAFVGVELDVVTVDE